MNVFFLIRSPFRYQPLEITRENNIVSSRESLGLTDQEIRSQEVYKGIHTHTVRNHRSSLNGNEFVVPVTVEPKDLIAMESNDRDNNSAVFNKVTIQKDELTEAVGRALKTFSDEFSELLLDRKRQREAKRIVDRALEVFLYY